MIPTEDLREVHAAAPVLPWAHAHGMDGKDDGVTFYSPGRPGEPLFTVHGADAATLEYLVMAVNNVENLLNVIDRPTFPDQFRDLTDDERQQLQVEKIQNIGESISARMEATAKASARRARWLYIVSTLNYIAVGAALTSGLYYLTMALDR